MNEGTLQEKQGAIGKGLIDDTSWSILYCQG